MFSLCPPALIYVVFSLTQIIIDTFKGYYNTAFIKFIVMIMITILLNILCEGGLTMISWFIVFIPFIMMTVITSMLLYIFGLSETTGKSSGTQQTGYVTTDANGNIIIYDPSYDATKQRVYYQSPNIIIPPPTTPTTPTTGSGSGSGMPPSMWSSSPEYQT